MLHPVSVRVVARASVAHFKTKSTTVAGASSSSSPRTFMTSLASYGRSSSDNNNRTATLAASTLVAALGTVAYQISQNECKEQNTVSLSQSTFVPLFCLNFFFANDKVSAINVYWNESYSF